jgi:hypothetical protein
VEEQAAMLVKYADLLVIQLKAAVQKNPVQDMSTRGTTALPSIL